MLRLIHKVSLGRKPPNRMAVLIQFTHYCIIGPTLNATFLNQCFGISMYLGINNNTSARII